MTLVLSFGLPKNINSSDIRRYNRQSESLKKLILISNPIVGNLEYRHSNNHCHILNYDQSVQLMRPKVRTALSITSNMFVLMPAGGWRDARVPLMSILLKEYRTIPS